MRDDGTALARTHGSTLDVPASTTMPPPCAVKELKPESRELGVIHFLALQLSPDIRRANAKRAREAAEMVDDFALDEDEDLSLIHISEPTRLLSISYAVFCLKKKKKKTKKG
eukprot:TRINITY_DN1347_c0_g1_i5.p1 TRINITY_DN1347_c0_g1~~TRINITY_DN1347_c0_g1_i5.p1  ORF type:complete len:112 (+),score=34.00 TRINITY_DN1347_c0_g1_i5:300-635(+)